MISRNLLRFEAFELDLRARELRKEGLSTGLPEQSIRILALLLERPGDVVLREEIRKQLWPNDTVVEFDHSINAAMKRLRQALGDSADNPRYIETLARRGYRWKLPVQCVEAPPEEPVAAVPASPATQDSGNLIGKKISHYRVLQVLGGGGMGVVYRAEDLKLGRPVALKFLPDELASDPQALKRFEHEARAASALNHPNICTIYAVEEHQGQPFIAMELLEGQTLRELIAAHRAAGSSNRQQALPMKVILDIGLQASRGLDAAHKKSIIHRDIKPANIFVTSHGQVKILDFGLAKLQAEGGDSESRPPVPLQTDEVANPTLTLTRTGTTVGTVQYMSPEQVRGEKLDVRSDLFSFGLVLYEMAAGHQAFTGQTAAVLRDAIVSREPTPLHELNPQVPTGLERIINHAIKKDRQLRYQSASEMRAALESLTSESKRERSGVSWRLASVAAVLVAVIGVFLWLRVPKHSGAVLPGFKEVQLTANSSENLVEDSAISPDGQYLAYADRKAIQIREIKSGTVRSIAPPDIPAGTELPAGSVAFAWFPDSERFAVTVNTQVFEEPDSFTSPQCTGVWVLSRSEAEPARKIYHDGCVGNVSPDGAWIAFTRNGRRSDQFGNQIWLMGPNGEQPHPVFERDEHSRYEAIRWSPDGRRLVYVLSRENGDDLGSFVQSRDLQGGPPVTIISDASVGDFYWLPGGLLVQSLREPGTQNYNFWVTPVDRQTGKALAAATRLTNWTRTEMDNFSASADGKRLAFFQHSGQGTIYIAELGGAGIGAPKHLTLSEDWNIGVAWAADSKAIIFASDRNHTWGLYRQSLDSDTPEPIITGLEAWPSFPRVSPDGAWLLYFQDRRSGSRFVSSDLMRIPITGGTPQFVLTAQPSARPSCSNAPATLCVISERSSDNERLVFTSFDPTGGRGAQIITLDGPFNADYSWGLSPDGTRLALARSADAAIEILPLNGGSAQKLPPGGWSSISALSWTSDGKGLIVSGLAHNRRTLIQIDLGGRSKVLWNVSSGLLEGATASPNGRHLAISQTNVNGNIWMLENF